jgi:hypothetical protein
VAIINKKTGERIEIPVNEGDVEVLFAVKGIKNCSVVNLHGSQLSRFMKARQCLTLVKMSKTKIIPYIKLLPLLQSNRSFQAVIPQLVKLP